MSIAQDLRKQANCIAVNVADSEGKDLRQSLLALADRVEKVEESERFLNCLEASGVDNWDGYGYAWAMMDNR